MSLLDLADICPNPQQLETDPQLEASIAYYLLYLTSSGQLPARKCTVPESVLACGSPLVSHRETELEILVT